MSEQSFSAWAIVELFGHQVTAGRLSEQTIGGEAVNQPAASAHEPAAPSPVKAGAL